MPTYSGPSHLVPVEDHRVTLVDGAGTPISGANPLPVSGAGGGGSSVAVLSVGNSTNTPLAGGATFVGAWENILPYVGLTVLVNSDSLASSGALVVQFSTDGVNVDRSVPVDVLVGGDFVMFATEAVFFRLRLTAGASAQTVLRIQTQYYATSPALKSTPLADVVTQSSTALLTRSAIVGRSTTGGGTFVDVKVNPSGALAADVTGSAVLANQGAPGATQWPTSDTSDQEYTHVVSTITSIGSTTVYTPAAGKRIRLRWVYAINDPGSSSAPLIRLLLGANEYYRCYALSKRQKVTGPVDGALIVDLSQSGSVAFTAILEEI